MDTLRRSTVGRCSLYACMVLLVTGCAGAQVLKIRPAGPHLMASGNRKLFTCLASGMDDVRDPKLRWRNPNGDVINATSGRTYVEKLDMHTLVMFITSIQEEEYGIYTCTAEYGASLLRAETQIILYEEMKFEELSNHKQVDVGGQTLLRCAVTGRPRPQITWRFNQKTLPSDSEKYTYTKDGLFIRDIKVADDGAYECRAEVRALGTMKSRKLTVEVFYPPEIISGPETKTVEIGSDVILRCLARGNPTVRYEWFVERTIQKNIKAKVPLRHSNTDILYRRQITNAAEGRYFCRAKNNLGQAEAYGDLTVIVPPKIHDIQERILVEGDSMVLPCESTGDPVPIVKWYRNNTPFTEGKQEFDSRIIVESPRPGSAKLVVENLNKNDTGMYRCVALNNIGRAEKTTTLTVHYKPRISSPKVKQLSWPGQTVSIPCRHDANPPPTVSWYHRNVLLRHNHTFSITTERGVSTLQFNISRQTPWIYGQFTCYAKNLYGLVKQTHTIIPIRVPSKPHNVTVSKITPNAVTMTMTLPRIVGRGAVDRIVIEGMKNGKSSKNKTWTFDAKETVTLKGLTPGLKYTLLISLGNIAGLGKASKIVILTKSDILSDTSDQFAKPPIAKNKTLATTTTQTSIGSGGEKKAIIIEEPLPPDNSPVGAVVGIVVTLLIIITGIIIAIWWFKFRRVRKQDYQFGAVPTNKKPDNKSIEDDPDKIDNPIKRKIKNMKIQHPLHIHMLSDKPITNPIEHRQSGEDYQFYKSAVEGTNNYYKVENGNFRPEDNTAHAQNLQIKRNQSNGAIVMIDHGAESEDNYVEITTAEVHNKRDSSPSPVLPDLPLSDPTGEFKLENIDWDRVLQSRTISQDQPPSDETPSVTYRNGRHHYNSPATQSNSDEHSESSGYNTSYYPHHYDPDHNSYHDYVNGSEDPGVTSDSDPIHTRYSLSIEDVTNSYLKSQHASEVDIPSLFTVQDRGLQF